MGLDSRSSVNMEEGMESELDGSGIGYAVMAASWGFMWS